MHNQNTPASCFYQSQDNLRLHYIFRAHPDSQSCCLLLHGFTNDAHIFDFLADKLQPLCNVIAVDFRGHGDSDWDANENYSHDQLIKDIYELTQRHEFTDWHVIGHSLGARVAMLTMASTDFVAKSLVIIDTGPEVNPIGVRKVRQDAENTPKHFDSTEHYFTHLSAIYFLANPSRLRHLASHGLKEHQGSLVAKTDPAFTRALWRHDSQQSNNTDLKAPKQHDLWQALAFIKCACLIIRGQSSAILTRKTAEAMQQVHTQAELVVIAGSGHALILDNPTDFEDTVTDFIKNQTP